MRTVRYDEVKPEENGHEYFQDELIDIQLTGRCNGSASIFKGESIKSLQQFSTVKDARFVYNGTILNPNLSFSFYGITSDAKIFVIGPEPKEEKPQEPQVPKLDMTQKLREHFNKKWANTTANPEEMFQRYLAAASPRTSMENARITDVARMKIEASPSGFRKICAKWKAANSAEPVPTALQSSNVRGSRAKIPN